MEDDDPDETIIERDEMKGQSRKVVDRHDDAYFIHYNIY